MIVVSNHLLTTTHVTFPEDIVVRLNLAWMKDKKTAIATLKKIKHDVYLDYPQGRSKPPKPVLTLAEALAIAKKFKNVKYFAVSNVEDPVEVKKMRNALPRSIEFVPKIETKRGVKNIPSIVKAGRVKYAMLDKEDLYGDVEHDSDIFDILVSAARMSAKESGIKLLELQGVVFA
jgi:citrate lyase beta subunit